MELHEVKMVNPNVFMGMDVVKRCLFLQDQINPLKKLKESFQEASTHRQKSSH